MTRFKVVIALVGMGSVVSLAGCASNKQAAEPAPAPAAAAAQPAAVPMVEITANSLNIRATPSATGAVVGSIKLGERVNAPQPASGGWQYVETDSGAKGYVASKYTRAVAGTAAAAAAAAPAAAGKPPAKPVGNAPAGSKLARVTAGMTEMQVQEILGQPTSQQSYFSAKVFIPWGKEAGKMDYRYKGVGIVVFSHHRYSGANTVVRTIYDPNEDGFK